MPRVWKVILRRSSGRAALRRWPAEAGPVLYVMLVFQQPLERPQVGSPECGGGIGRYIRTDASALPVGACDRVNRTARRHPNPKCSVTLRIPPGWAPPPTPAEPVLSGGGKRQLQATSRDSHTTSRWRLELVGWNRRLHREATRVPSLPSLLRRKARGACAQDTGLRSRSH
jgi:hypothetical protein